ncbi:hypothetical protein QQF64_017809, partial [Cirrhinus molitorella]
MRMNRLLCCIISITKEPDGYTAASTDRIDSTCTGCFLGWVRLDVFLARGSFISDSDVNKRLCVCQTQRVTSHSKSRSAATSEVLEAWVRFREEDLQILARHNSQCPGTFWRTESEGTSGRLFFPGSPLSPPAQSSSPGPAHPPLDAQIKPKLIPSTHAHSEASWTGSLGQRHRHLGHGPSPPPSCSRVDCGKSLLNTQQLESSERIRLRLKLYCQHVRHVTTSADTPYCGPCTWSDDITPQADVISALSRISQNSIAQIKGIRPFPSEDTALNEDDVYRSLEELA